MDSLGASMTQTEIMSLEDAHATGRPSLIDADCLSSNLKASKMRKPYIKVYYTHVLCIDIYN